MKKLAIPLLFSMLLFFSSCASPEFSLKDGEISFDPVLTIGMNIEDIPEDRFLAGGKPRQHEFMGVKFDVEYLESSSVDYENEPRKLNTVQYLCYQCPAEKIDLILENLEKSYGMTFEESSNATKDGNPPSTTAYYMFDEKHYVLFNRKIQEDPTRIYIAFGYSEAYEAYENGGA